MLLYDPHVILVVFRLTELSFALLHVVMNLISSVTLGSVTVVDVHCESKKTCHSGLRHIFGRC